jgi:hydroxymethylpyrimidine/phosphomethylpyrimidine kinase
MLTLPSHPPIVVSIAGTDPSGGAGIQADIKAISATGGYAASIITVLVAQNTRGVNAVEEVSLSFLQQQIDAVFSDLHVAAVKIGMLYKKTIIEVIAQNIEKYSPPFIVLDPVITAQSGDRLLEEDAIEALKGLLCKVDMITPNIPEAEILLGQTIDTPQKMHTAAEILSKHYNTSVLLKGGHLTGAQCPDIFYNRAKQTHFPFISPRVDTQNTHGTGCSLSAAIASYLAQGETYYEAIKKAKHYLFNAIAAAKDFHIGKGQGPIHHFYALRRESYVI